MWLKLNDAWLGQDKYLHWLGGTLLGVVLSLLLSLQPMKVAPIGVLVLSWAVGFFVAFGKEYWDFKHPPQTASLQDALTTVGGSLVGILAGLQLARFISGGGG